VSLRAACLFLATFLGIGLSSCSVGEGSGSVTGSLRVDACEDPSIDLAAYDMEPDFFGAIAAKNQLMIRIQRGGDLQEYNDSLTIVVDDTTRVVDGQPIQVELQRPPPTVPNAAPPLVRVTLSLRGTCGTGRLGGTDPAQVVLHAIGGTVTFRSILRGDPSSPDTNSKRIEGSFDVILEDPRFTGTGRPRSEGTLRGDFKFFYQRGGPAQPFP
jgi:hypothetical protein